MEPDPFETFGEIKYFSDDPLILGIFHFDDPKELFSFTFQPKFREFSSNG